MIPEATIASLETERDTLHAEMGDPGFYRDDASRVVRSRTRLDALESEIADAYARWELLEAKLRKLSAIGGKPG